MSGPSKTYPDIEPPEDMLCPNCDHEFSEDEALSIRGMIEDEETDDQTRIVLISWVSLTESEDKS